MRIRTILLTALGLLFLALGLIGVFLPILPTTPFVLLGAACLTGTPKLRERILRITFFREYLENYQKGNGLPRRTVIKSLIFLWGMLLISMFLVAQLWLTLLLIVVGICVTIHILWIAKPKGDRK
jgi:uncharacterized membrane protein YbaN (DUF454 family)